MTLREGIDRVVGLILQRIDRLDDRLLDCLLNWLLNRVGLLFWKSRLTFYGVLHSGQS